MARTVKEQSNSASRALPGGQTTQRKLQQQFNLRGGLATATDISTSNPNEWLSSSNAKMPTIGSNLLGGITNAPTPQSMFSANTYTDSTFGFNTQPRDFCIASCEIGVTFPSETVVYSGTGTGSTINSISVGDKCIQLALTASQNITATLTVPAKNTFLFLTSGQNILALDTNWTNYANFSSGFVRVGSDSSNYYQWAMTGATADGNKVLKFNWASPTSTTGSPNTQALTYVVIQATATAGGSLTIQCSNMRIGSFGAVSQSDNTYQPLAATILSVFPYVSDSNNAYRQLIINTGQNLYIQTVNNVLGSTDSALIVKPLKTGFSYVFSHFAYYNSFYFNAFPKTGSNGQNILYWVNGLDGIFSYDANASAGSRFSQISSTAYKYIVSHKNYMWYAGDPANPNTIVPSVLSTPGTLDTANAITLDNQDGQNIITGLISMDDYLIIFRTKDIWIMLGTTTGVGGDIIIRKTNSTQGAVHQKAITRMGINVYFSNGKKVFVFDGNQSVCVSSKINLYPSSTPNYQGISLIYNPNEECVYCYVLPFDPGNYSLDPVSTSGRTIFIYNPSLRVWTESANTFGGDATDALIGGFIFNSPYDNTTYFYQFGLYILTTVSGTYTFPTTWNNKFQVQTNWNTLGSPFVLKDPSQIRLFINAANSGITGTLAFYADFINSIIYTTTFTVPQNITSGYVDINIGPGCQGHSFGIQVIVPNTNLAPSGTIDFSGYAISWTEAEVI